MTLDQIISGLEDQARDKDSLVPTDDINSIFAHDAKTLRAAVKLLKRQPNICTVLGVRTEQEFVWRSYTLKVSSKNGAVCKQMVGGDWLGLEGIMVCELINNPQDLMRYSRPPLPNVPLTLEELLEMDGEPVWVTTYLNEAPSWFLVNVAANSLEAGQRVIPLSEFKSDWPYRAYRRRPETEEVMGK